MPRKCSEVLSTWRGMLVMRETVGEGQGGSWELSVLSTQFRYGPKHALKNSLCGKKITGKKA